MEAAFFDLDKTVITKASVLAFGYPMYHQGLLSKKAVLKGLYAQAVYLHLGANEDRLARLRDSVLALTKGWEQAKVRRIIEEALDEVIAPIIYKDALELMDRHRAEGRLIVIVSASPEEMVLPLSRYLGADEAIASRARIDEFGRYTGEMAFYAYGPYKAEAMRELAQRRGLDLSRSYAYSDSYTDLPMLEAVGHPVAVNPDRVLQRIAKDRGWEVVRFSRPVQMRPPAWVGEIRLGRPHAWAAAALLAAGAAAALTWRIGTRAKPASL